MQEMITYINPGPAPISIDFTSTTIENYSAMFGKKRVIKTCPIKSIVRITKDITTFENKTKLTLYYNENNKEKRFGGMGFSIEGNLIDPTFQEVIAFLEHNVPAHTIWEDKAASKASTRTQSGSFKYPIAASLNFFFSKHPMHSGERGLAVGLKIGLAILLGLSGLLVISVTLMSPSNILATLLSLVLISPFVIYAFLVLQMAFKKGGLHYLFLNNKSVQINFALKSVSIPFSDIKTFSYQVIDLKIKNINFQSTSSSIEYEFKINNKHKFTMGENTAMQFISKVNELNLPLTNK